jgi:hypothetical protein
MNGLSNKLMDAIQDFALKYEMVPRPINIRYIYNHTRSKQPPNILHLDVPASQSNR